MTRLALLALLAVSSVAAAAPPQLDQASAEVKAVVAREQELNAVLLAHDEAKLKTILAAEFMAMTPRGLIPANLWIEGAVRRMQITKLELKEARGAVYGDTAIVWSRIAYAATLAAPDPKTGAKDLAVESVLTDVWTKRDGAWILATRQSTPAAK